MKVTESISELRNIIKSERTNGKRIAFVPTMGYLHNGHLNLMKIARQNGDFVVVSIFVNPTQFGPNEDFERYPRDIARDSELCQSVGVDLIYTPQVIDMYPIGYASIIKISKVTEMLEGEKRPGHFDGVATVVAKLFNIVMPDTAIFGQKDFQQCLLIKKMVKDLNFDIEIIVAPTLRENDGLAMSSRNVYLNVKDREVASILFATLERAKQLIEQGETDRKIINAFMINNLRKIENLKIDYAVSALANDLSFPDYFMAGDEVVLLLAVFLGKTRLIDNTTIKIPSKLNF